MSNQIGKFSKTSVIIAEDSGYLENLWYSVKFELIIQLFLLSPVHGVFGCEFMWITCNVPLIKSYFFIF